MVVFLLQVAYSTVVVVSPLFEVFAMTGEDEAEYQMSPSTVLVLELNVLSRVD